MGDDIKGALKLSQMLVMTPQLQQAIRMLATPAAELSAMVDKLRSDHPGCVVDEAPGILVEAASDNSDQPVFEWLAESPFPPHAELADVFVFGNPPQARANPHAFPRFSLAPGCDPEVARQALWLARAFRQRAKTCEKVVAVLVARQPALAIATALDAIDPITVRAVAEAVGMHESTITRVASACRLQNLHGVFPIAPLVGSKRRAKPRPRR